jgi:hypothetical protein
LSFSNQRYRFNGRYVSDTQACTNSAGASSNIEYAWFGSNTRNTGTWDYAPVSELQEVEPERFDRWLYRINNDQSYAAQQITMNERQRVWHSEATTAGTVIDNLKWYTYSTGINGWTLTSDFNRLQQTRPLWHQSQLCYFVRFNLFKNVKNPIQTLKNLRHILQVRRAEKKSWQLVREWLSEEEFAELMSKGEMEVQSKEDRETIYIIKRDPLARVLVKKNDKVIEQRCLIPKEYDCPSGDGFLSKLMLLKTDEKKFMQIAVRSHA